MASDRKPFAGRLTRRRARFRERSGVTTGRSVSCKLPCLTLPIWGPMCVRGGSNTLAQEEGPKPGPAAPSATPIFWRRRAQAFSQGARSAPSMVHSSRFRSKAESCLWDLRKNRARRFVCAAVAWADIPLEGRTCTTWDRIKSSHPNVWWFCEPDLIPKPVRYPHGVMQTTAF